MNTPVVIRSMEASQIDALWELQLRYKAEIGEDEPQAQDKERLARAMEAGQILFYGAWDGNVPVGCCSVTKGFSTFDYRPCGVLEDFYIRPEYRRRGIGTQMVAYCMRELRKMGINKVALIACKKNDAGNAFWSKIGWTRSDVNYYEFLLNEENITEFIGDDDGNN